MAVALDEAWIEGLVEASGAAEAPVPRSALVAFTIGKSQRVALEIVDGRVVGPSPAGDDEVDVSIPVTAQQLAGFADGSQSMSRAYMRGDLKPVGSTGALLAILALFDDPSFRAALAR
jgi:hypothetical protein